MSSSGIKLIPGLRFRKLAKIQISGTWIHSGDFSDNYGFGYQNFIIGFARASAAGDCNTYLGVNIYVYLVNCLINSGIRKLIVKICKNISCDGYFHRHFWAFSVQDFKSWQCSERYPKCFFFEIRNFILNKGSYVRF